MREALSAAEWLITEDGFDPERANVRETLCTVGNGYLGTRGTLEEGHPGELSGTYLAGVYDSHDSPVIDLVNAPDWLSFAVYVEGTRLDVGNATVLDHERTLDLRTGLLYRRTVFEDADGRRTRLETLRCASIADRHRCALRVEITPENHDGEITVESALDGRRRNLERLPVYPAGHVFPVESRWEKWALTRHLERTERAADGDVAYLEMRTLASGITLGYAATTIASVEPTRSGWTLEDERVVWRAAFPGGPAATGQDRAHRHVARCRRRLLRSGRAASTGWRPPGPRGSTRSSPRARPRGRSAGTTATARSTATRPSPRPCASASTTC